MPNFPEMPTPGTIVTYDSGPDQDWHLAGRARILNNPLQFNARQEFLIELIPPLSIGPSTSIIRDQFQSHGQNPDIIYARPNQLKI